LAAKSGTTSLHEILGTHPEISMSSKKELGFFHRDEVFSRGYEWYKNQFQSKPNAKLWGESTPSYMHFDMAPRRIYETLAQPRLIVLLRNPVDRAVSQYKHKIRNGQETLSLVEALKTEESRIKISQSARTRFSYVERGLYCEHIMRYWDLFGQDSVYLIRFEDFVSKKERTIRLLLKWLGVSPDAKLDLEIVSNPASLPRSMPLHRFVREDGIAKRFFRRIAPEEVRKSLSKALNQANDVFNLLPQHVHVPDEVAGRELLHEKLDNQTSRLAEILGWDLSSWLGPKRGF
jgi:hypothetical protein